MNKYKMSFKDYCNSYYKMEHTILIQKKNLENNPNSKYEQNRLVELENRLQELNELYAKNK